MTKEQALKQLEAVMSQLEAWAEYEVKQLENCFLDSFGKESAMNRATNYYNLASKINIAVSNL